MSEATRPSMIQPLVFLIFVAVVGTIAFYAGPSSLPSMPGVKIPPLPAMELKAPPTTLSESELKAAYAAAHPATATETVSGSTAETPSAGAATTATAPAASWDRLEDWK